MYNEYKDLLKVKSKKEEQIITIVCIKLQQDGKHIAKLVSKIILKKIWTDVQKHFTLKEKSL